MKDQENDPSELKLKTLTEILAGLSLPELMRLQGIISRAIVLRFQLRDLGKDIKK